MAHMVAWLIVAPFALAWLLASSSLWVSFLILGWRNAAHAVAVRPILALQEWLAPRLTELHEFLWVQIGRWTIAVYAAIVLILMYIGSP